MAEEVDEFGIPIRKPSTQGNAVDEFGIPIKKKTPIANDGQNTSLPSNIGGGQDLNSLTNTNQNANYAPVTDPTLRQQMIDHDTAVRDQKLQQQQRVSKQLSKIRSELPANSQANWDNAVNLSQTRNPDELHGATPEEISHYNFMQTPVGKTLGAVAYLGSKATKGTLQIAKGAAHYANQAFNATNPAASISTDLLADQADKASDFGLTRGDQTRMDESKILSNVGGLAEFAPAAATAASTGGATLFLQGAGQAQEQLDKAEQASGEKVNPLVREAFIGGTGIVNKFLMHDLAGGIFNKLPAGLRGDITAKITADAIKEASGKELTGEAFNNLLQQGAVQWADKVAKTGVNALQGTGKAALDLSALAGSNFLLKKGVDATTDQPIFNENAGDLAQQISEIATQTAPVFGIAGQVSNLSKLTPYSNYKNTVVESLMHDPSEANIQKVKQDLVDFNNSQDPSQQWSRDELDATVQNVDKIADVAKKLPRGLKDDKLVDAIDLVNGRDELKQQLAEVQKQRSDLDESVREVPSEGEQLLTDKIDQANDKLKAIASGRPVTYSKETDPETEESTYYKKFRGQEKEEITQSRYDLENLERDANKEPEVTNENTTTEVPQTDEARIEENVGKMSSTPEITDEQRKAQNEETDAKVKAFQEKFPDRNVDPLEDLPESVVRTFDRVDSDLPTDPVAINEASDWLYKKYKQLTAMKESDTRLLTTDQIDAMQEQLGQDITLLENNKLKYHGDNEAVPTGERATQEAQAQPAEQAIGGANESTGSIEGQNQVANEQPQVEPAVKVPKSEIKPIETNKSEPFKNNGEHWTHLTDSKELIDSLLAGNDFIGKGEDLANFTKEVSTKRFNLTHENALAPYFQKGKFYGEPRQKYLIVAKGDEKFTPNINHGNAKNLEMSAGVGVLNPEYRNVSNFDIYEKGADGEFYKIERPKESIPSEETPKAPAIKNANTKQAAGEAGIELEDHIGESRTSEKVDKEATQKIKDGYDSHELVRKVLEDGHIPNDTENAILAKYTATVEKNYQDLTKRLEEEGATMTKRQFDDLTAEHDQASKDYQDALNADVKAGTAQGRALSSRRFDVANDFSLGQMIKNKRTANNGEKLTPEQLSDVTKRYNEIEEANKRLQERVSKLESDNSRIKAEKAIKRIKDGEARLNKKTATKEALAEDRKKIAEEFSAKLKAMRQSGALNSVGKATFEFLQAAAPYVAKMVRNLALEGVTEIKDVISRVKEELDLGELSDREVTDLIAGNYSERKATKNELTDQIKDLKMQASLMGQIEDAEKNVTKNKGTKKEVQYSDKVKALQTRLNELTRKEPPTREETSLKQAKTATQKRIADLERRIRENDFSKPEPATKPDQELLDLRRQSDRLKQEYQVQLAKDQLANRSKIEKTKDNLLNIASLPRALKASLDFSAVLRQGLFATAGHPKQAFEAFKEMFRQTISEEKYKNWISDLKNEPIYDLMKKSDLYLSDKNDPKLLAREEEFTSNLADKIPGIGKLIAASERAYTGYLNVLRAGVFTSEAQKLIQKGYTFENNPEQFKSLAKVVNVLTGRGDIPEWLGGKQPKLLSSALFSPRFMAARIQTLYLWADPRLSREAKILAAKDIGSTLASGAVILSLASLAGYKVVTDPRSSNFLKVQDKQEHGTSYYDILGGLPQYIRFLSQQISGQKKPANDKGMITLGSKKYGSPTRLTEAARFIRGKFSPLVGAGTNLLEGKDVIGQPYHFWPNVPEEFVPLPFSDVQDAYKVGGITGALKAFLPSQFGVGVSSYDPNAKRAK